MTPTNTLSGKVALVTGGLRGIGAAVVLACSGADVAISYTISPNHAHAIVPGLILSGISQGIMWRGMCIAAASGIRNDEQDVASRVALTTLSVGNVIGLAVRIAVANGHAAGQVGIAHLAAVAEGIRLAFWLAAGGILVSLLAALTLSCKASVTGL